MPPLGKPSAISYSRSSARSDLKVFTFPLASYNFRMRAICDVSDMRILLRLSLLAKSRGEQSSLVNKSARGAPEISVFNRHSRDSRRFRDKVVPLAGLGNQ